MQLHNGLHLGKRVLYEDVSTKYALVCTRTAPGLSQVEGQFYPIHVQSPTQN
jgi:hypothetical protein